MARAKKKVELNTADVLANVGESVTAAHTLTEQRAKRGRKPGTKSTCERRMNIAITEEQKDFLQIVSRLRGISQNDLVKEIFQAAVDDNREIFEQCRRLTESLAHKRRELI